VKAVNYLLPHVQRVPSRIVRDELVREIAQKLAIDSAVLRQELKHAAAKRSAHEVKTPVEGQVTDAERILIRALTSAREMQTMEEHVSARDGADEEFDPARQAEFALRSEQLHRGLATEGLLEALLSAPESDPLSAEMTEADRNLLASILMTEGEELTAQRLEGAVRGLRRIRIRRHMEAVQRELQPGRKLEPERLRFLLGERERLKRALRDPALLDQESPPAA
jgi:DNA primase